MAASMQDDADSVVSTTGVYYGGVKLKPVSRQPSSSSTLVSSMAQKVAAEADSAATSVATPRANGSLASDSKDAANKQPDTRPADSRVTSSTVTPERSSAELSAVRRPNAAVTNANGAAGTGKEPSARATTTGPTRSVEFSRGAQPEVRRDNVSLTVTSLELQRTPGDSVTDRTTEREAGRLVRAQVVNKSNDASVSEPAERHKLGTALTANRTDQAKPAAADGKTSHAADRGATGRMKPEYEASSNAERRVEGSRTFYGRATSAIDTQSTSKGTKAAAGTGGGNGAGAGADTRAATTTNKSLKLDTSNSASARRRWGEIKCSALRSSRDPGRSPTWRRRSAELSVAPPEKTQTTAADLLRRGSGWDRGLRLPLRRRSGP
jgi:hypothetical protein